MFDKLFPSILPLLKEHIRLRPDGIVNNSIEFIQTRLRGGGKRKEWT